MIKRRVKITGIVPQMALAYAVVSPILHAYGQPPVITSGTEGKHARKSAHKTGRAIDMRSKQIRDADKKHECRGAMSAALGDEFDVLLEHVGKPVEHFHIEWDPK